MGCTYGVKHYFLQLEIPSTGVGLKTHVNIEYADLNILWKKNWAKSQNTCVLVLALPLIYCNPGQNNPLIHKNIQLS